MDMVYLDNGATTQVDKVVLEEMQRIFTTEYGNASSIHHFGNEAREDLEHARQVIAKSLKCRNDEIFFTGSGTEANNWVTKGLAFFFKKQNENNKDSSGNYKGNYIEKNHIVITKVEHDCLLKSCQWLETQGIKVTYLDVDEKGFVDQQLLDRSITENTFLVSIIHGNNEIGTIQDIHHIYDICKKHKVLFHTDACQSYTKTDITSEDADLITINAHKIHGPKGVGALYIKKGLKPIPLLHGGGQEKNMRSGTENIPAIMGFAKAVEVAFDEKKKNIDQMTELRDYMIEELKNMKCVILNGPEGDMRLCNNVNLSFRFIEGESIVSLLDCENICVSTGSACSSNNLEPSHVMMAIENNPERAHGSVRFTLSKWTTKKEIDYTIKHLKHSVEELRKISPLCDDCECKIDKK